MPKAESFDGKRKTTVREHERKTKSGKKTTVRKHDRLLNPKRMEIGMNYITFVGQNNNKVKIRKENMSFNELNEYFKKHNEIPKLDIRNIDFLIPIAEDEFYQYSEWNPAKREYYGALLDELKMQKERQMQEQSK